MSPGEREHRMVESRSGPGDRYVAPIAILRPALCHVIRVDRACQILLVASFTTNGSSAEVADLSAGMTAEAGDCRVSADQREPRAVVQDGLAFGNPIALVVALDTLRAELPTMYVFVAARATSLCKECGWPAIVVAAQTLCILVGADQCKSRFLFVRELEILADVLPPSPFMAE